MLLSLTRHVRRRLHIEPQFIPFCFASKWEFWTKCTWGLSWNAVISVAFLFILVLKKKKSWVSIRLPSSSRLHGLDISRRLLPLQISGPGASSGCEVAERFMHADRTASRQYTECNIPLPQGNQDKLTSFWPNCCTLKLRRASSSLDAAGGLLRRPFNWVSPLIMKINRIIVHSRGCRMNLGATASFSWTWPPTATKFSRFSPESTAADGIDCERLLGWRIDSHQTPGAVFYWLLMPGLYRFYDGKLPNEEILRAEAVPR